MQTNINFWKKLKNTYRFQVIDEKTYEVKWVFELNRLNVFIAGSVLIIGILLFSFLIFSFTPLRFLLPGYVGTNAQEKRDIIALKMNSEALANKVAAQDLYFENLRKILTDSVDNSSKRNDRIDIALVDTSLFYSQPGKLESKFRKDFELLLKQGDNLNKSAGALSLTKMGKPIEGRPMIVEDGNNKMTLNIKGKSDAPIKAPLDGTVVARFDSGNEQYIYIQHIGDILSALHFKGTSNVSKGAVVFKGQIIGEMDEAGDKVLMFDLWSAGEPLPPGQFLKY